MKIDLEKELRLRKMEIDELKMDIAVLARVGAIFLHARKQYPGDVYLTLPEIIKVSMVEDIVDRWTTK